MAIAIDLHTQRQQMSPGSRGALGDSFWMNSVRYDGRNWSRFRANGVMTWRCIIRNVVAWVSRLKQFSGESSRMSP